MSDMPERIWIDVFGLSRFAEPHHGDSTEYILASAHAAQVRQARREALEAVLKLAEECEKDTFYGISEDIRELIGREGA